MISSLIVFSLAACTPDPVDSGTTPLTDDSIPERVDPEAIDRRLRELSELTALHGDRLATSEGEAAALAWARTELEALGWTVDEQPVTWGIPLRTSYNLVATSPFGNADQLMILGAHLDTVADVTGMNDNGSGVVACLGLAQAMSERLRAPDHQARVVLFTREEDWRLGSYTYSESLSESEAEATVAMLNLDMLGSPNGFPYIMDGYSLEGELGDASDALTTLLVQAMNDDGQPWDLFDYNIYSDHAYFIDRDIPIAYLATGGGDAKTEEQAAEFGGTAGEPYDPNYHTPADDLDNVDQELMLIMTRAAAGAIQQLVYEDPSY